MKIIRYPVVGAGVEAEVKMGASTEVELGVECEDGLDCLDGLQYTEKEIMRMVKVLKTIGEGASGEALLVKYRGETAVLKLGHEIDIQTIEQYTDEAKRLVQVAGAGGAPILLAVASDAPVIVTTLCPGKSLSTWLGSQDVDADLLLQLALALTTSLKDLHRTNIIHNDIKGNNIMIDWSEGRPIV